MIFLDTNIISYYFNANEKIKEKIIETIDDDAIDIAANIYSNLRKSGKATGDADILIAAIVIKNNGTLVSNNIKHFEDINQLKLINWI